MFKVAPRQTFTHDVTVMVPVDGGHQADTLKTTFNYVDQDEVNGFNLRSAEGTIAFVTRIVHGFHDLEDESGNAVPYTEELRDRLIRRLEVRVALSDHYFQAISKAKEGN